VGWGRTSIVHIGIGGRRGKCETPERKSRREAFPDHSREAKRGRNFANKEKEYKGGRMLRSTSCGERHECRMVGSEEETHRGGLGREGEVAVVRKKRGEELLTLVGWERKKGVRGMTRAEGTVTLH